ncbi:hypothetical protein E1B28_010564 [Marasmius oreades]|uniref:F-box domain-containing protein n=1 Tax=Marasmius oreades TaxID=181124 RepID=A0A9P7URW6_9AGAR|nr:uncharacterized protein E1B28_010564 [Marasmius oreades]KAG7091535.1 hypothetical protein E1B28_010564 [Marasmius oreades]
MNTIFPDIQLRALKPPMQPAELLKTLRFNVSLTSSQEINCFIQEAEHDLNLYDKLIQHIKIKKAALKNDITRYRSLQSPIRKLPPETLRRIFGIAAGPNQCGRPCHGRGTSIFRLSSVCTRWREVALNSPELWANISIYMDLGAIRPLELCLRRSQQHPLSLQLDPGWDRAQAGTPISELFRLLLEHSRRWQHLDVRTVDFFAFDGIGEMPLLQSVKCCPFAGEIMPFGNAPNLRQLQILQEFHDVGEPVDLTSLPWSTLRHLDLVDTEHYWDREAIVECFRRGNKLQSFVYRHESEEYPSIRTRNEHCVVSNIESLSLELPNPDSFNYVLSEMIQAVTLPSLVNFTISCTPPEPYGEPNYIKFFMAWPGNVFSEFMERSKCNLTTLALKGIPLSESKLMPLLQLTPSLHTFILHEFLATEDAWDDDDFEDRKNKYQTVTESFLNRLAVSPLTADPFLSRNPLLPKLKWFTLRVQSHFDADAAFVELVKSRWVYPTGDLPFHDMETLRTVELHVLNRSLPKKVYEPLKAVDADGMMISVFGNGKRIV